MSKFLPLNLFIRQALLYPLTAPFLPAVGDVKDGIKYAADKLEGTYECPPSGGLPWTGQVTIYFADDDGDYQKGLTLTRPIVKGAVGNTRFVDNDDNTITDLATGLMWIKDYVALGAPFNATVLWQPAIENCEALVHAGHNDWRLPNVKELFSIADFGFSEPAIDAGIFPNTQEALYYRHWTSTTMIRSAANGVTVEFRDGIIALRSKGSGSYWVRPVRLGLPE